MRMRYSAIIRAAIASLILGWIGPAHSEPPPEGLDAQIEALTKVYRENGQQQITPVMLLGVFHFEGSPTDTRSAGDANMLSPERQVEVDDVLDRLEAYAPTKVCVEVEYSEQAQVDADYAAYLAGEFTLTASEIHQLGFRLAKRLGHTEIYSVDALGRNLEREAGLGEVAERAGQLWLDNDPVDAGWEKMADLNDEWIHTQPLKDNLLLLNDPRYQRMAHAVYMTRYLSISDGTFYPKADSFPTKWYNRNLRIFGNILRVAEDSKVKDEERVLVVIGAGHVPILEHFADNSGSLELVEVSEVLGDDE